MKLQKLVLIIILIAILLVSYIKALKRKGKFSSLEANSIHHIVRSGLLKLTYKLCEKLGVPVAGSLNNFQDNKRNMVIGPNSNFRLIDDKIGIDYEILVLLIKETKLKTLLLGLNIYIDNNLKEFLKLNDFSEEKKNTIKQVCTNIRVIWKEILKFPDSIYSNLNNTELWLKKDNKYYLNKRFTEEKTKEKELIQKELDKTGNSAIKILEEIKEEIIEKSVLLDNRLNDDRKKEGLEKI